MGADTAPAFDLLAYPAMRKPKCQDYLTDISGEQAREHYARSRGEVELICHSQEALSSAQRIGSWVLDGEVGASCSAWTTSGILEEVVVGLPPTLRMASWVLGGTAARGLGLPHVPRVGEALQSWLVFDAAAGSETAARRLVAAVAARARLAGKDFCHVVLPPGSSWREALRRDVPTAFAPVLPFSIMARTLAGKPLHLPGPIIDPMDI
jgi:hypothetical protein